MVEGKEQILAFPTKRQKSEMRVKPVAASCSMEDPDIEQMCLCVKIITKLVIFFSNALGLWPFKPEEREFRLFSKKSFVSLVKLIFLTTPVLIVPNILYYVSWTNHELDDKYVGMEETFVEYVTFGVEFYSNFLIFILPFAFASKIVAPVMKIRHIRMSVQNREILEHVDSRGMIIPLIGFLLFILGKFIRMTNDLLEKWQLEGFSTMYRAIYLHITLYFLAHILLHFFLASYEYFFYRSYNDFRTLANSLLKGRFPTTKAFLQRTEECALVMEYFHRAFGLFLLVRRILRKLTAI